MVKQVVRLTLTSRSMKANLDAFKSIAHAMTEGSKAEPGTLGYEWFSSADGNRFRLVETYVNAGAVEAHFVGPVVQEWVPKLAAVCTVDGFEIYGDPGPQVAKAAGGLGAVVFQYWHGIDRLMLRTRRSSLLLFEVDALVLMAGDAGADLSGGLAGLGQAIGVEGFLSAGGALGSMQALVAATQAGVAQGAIAAAVAGQLIDDIANFDCLLIDVDLPGIAEVLTGEFGASEDGRQGADFERRGRVVSRNLVSRV